jgi:predicted ATPase
VEVLVREHPLRRLKQELQVHGECAELLLDFLSEEAVSEYLAVRLSIATPSAAPLPGLAQTIHRRTDGNPLFMVTVVNDLVARGMLVQRQGRWELEGRVEEVADRVPESLQQLIAQQFERSSPETRHLLEVGSVAGAAFSAAAVAAGMETEVERVEVQGEELVRREHFLRASGTAEWPDGTVAARYGFLHAWCQEVVYQRLTARQRQWLHQRIGEREEAGYGERAREIAAELAVHFEQGRDYRRAVQYLQQAGWNAVRRCAPQEAIDLLTKGLKLLKTWPDSPERLQQELTLQNTLISPLVFSKGYAAPELENVLARTRELSEQLGESPLQLFWTLLRLCAVHVHRAEFQTAHELAEQCLHLAQGVRGSTHHLIWAHHLLGRSFFCKGEFVLALSHLEESIAFYDPQQHRTHTFRFGENPQTSALRYLALVLWHLGYPDQALKKIHNAFTLVHELSHPFTLANLLSYATWFHQYRREARLVQERAEALITLSAEQGFLLLPAFGTLLQGWALAEQGQEEEAIAQIHQGLAARRAMGVESGRPYFLGLLAEAFGKRGQAQEGLNVLAEALATVHKTGERYYEPELYRLKGELTLAPSSVRRLASTVTNAHSPTLDPQAEASFLKAIEIARRQQAKSLELRATMSLARLWQQQGKREAARQRLAEIYSWFTEGFDTKDLQEAKALMQELT